VAQASLSLVCLEELVYLLSWAKVRNETSSVPHLNHSKEVMLTLRSPAVADMHSTPLSMVVPLAFMIVASSYAVCVNFVPSYRDPADKSSTAKVGIEGSAHGAAIDDVESGSGNHGIMEKSNVETSEDIAHSRA
jgi:hypothetical protein